MLKTCTGKSVSNAVSEPLPGHETSGRFIRSSSRASPSNRTTVLTELFQDIREKDWVTSLHETTLNQPNLASVLTAIQWILPAHSGETLTLGTLNLAAHDEHLKTTPEMCLLDPAQLAPASARNTEASQRVFALGLLGHLFSGKSTRKTERGSAPAMASSEDLEGMTSHLPRTEGTAPHEQASAMLVTFEHLARQADMSKSWPLEAEAHLIRNETGKIDLSPVFRDVLITQLNELVRQTELMNHPIVQEFGFLQRNPSIDTLLSAISCLESPVDNLHHLPLPARLAILIHAPDCVPLLATARHLLHIAGQKASPPVQRFTLFDETDETFKQRLITRPEGAYAPTFVAGVERMMDGDGGKPEKQEWRILQADGSYLPTNRFSDVLVAVSRNAILHSLPGQPDPELPVWNWPLSLHAAASRATRLPIPSAFVETEALLSKHIEANRKMADAKQSEFRQEEQRRRQARDESDRRFQADMSAQNCYTIETMMMAESAPAPLVAQLSDAYIHVLPSPEQNGETKRECLLNTLAERFDRQEVSHRKTGLNGTDAGADNLCWLRAGMASVLLQLTPEHDIQAMLSKLRLPRNMQDELAFILSHLQWLHAHDPDLCFGRSNAGGDDPIRITPGMTVEQLHQLSGSQWVLKPSFAKQTIESALKRANAYLALGFRFESPSYAAEVAHLVPWYNRGAGAELPLALHRCLSLPIMVIEYNARGPDQINVRVALPKGHPLHAEWEQLSTEIDRANGSQRQAILHRMLDRFSGLPILYLETLTQTDSLGHYTLYVPRTGGHNTPPVSDRMSAEAGTSLTHPHQTGQTTEMARSAARLERQSAPYAPMTSHLNRQNHWSMIEHAAQQMRVGSPDTGNVNSSGFAGLDNDWQIRWNGCQFNAHWLAKDVDSSQNPVLEPVTFAQSPDRTGKGTAGTALSWLQLAASQQVPIFQCVHPTTLRDGSHRNELSLIKLLQEEIQRTPRLAQDISIREISTPGASEASPGLRTFQVRITRDDAGSITGRATRSVYVTLCAAQLRNGVLSNNDLQSCSAAFDSIMQPYYQYNGDYPPIVMSTGGFGRSSCLGVMQSIKQRLRSRAMSLHETLNITDQLIMLGKAMRGPQFIPSLDQYQHLMAAIEAYWHSVSAEVKVLENA